MAKQRQDYYCTLGVNKDSSDSDIKRSYRMLAMKWHPDKNPDSKQQATEKFKEISEAYEVLSDPAKRKRYDTYGTFDDGGEFSQFHQGFSADHAQRVFEMFFGFSNPFDDPFFQRSQSHLGFGFNHPANPLGRTRSTGNRQHDPFSSFFGGGMFSDPFAGFMGGGNNGATVITSSFASGGGGGGFCQSMSTSTKVVNGTKIIRTEKTVTNPDGTVSRTVTEERDDGRGNKSVHQIEGPGSEGGRVNNRMRRLER